jgi:beta-alanine degradation protein BauB
MSSRPQAVPHVHISEPHVRVTEWRFTPGAETGWHRHQADYVVVPMLDGDLMLEEPGGGSRTATLKKHVTMWSTPTRSISPSWRSST